MLRTPRTLDDLEDWADWVEDQMDLFLDRVDRFVDERDRWEGQMDAAEDHRDAARERSVAALRLLCRAAENSVTGPRSRTVKRKRRTRTLGR